MRVKNYFKRTKPLPSEWFFMEKFIGWKSKKPTSFSLMANTLDWARQVTVNHMQVFTDIA
ncbi:hypothetical protein A7M82_05470 [Acinetobacter baumannii]|nr:hypothetical protein APC63_17120 [Acinetobacter baumannii]KRI11015.1 hypothetical protein APC85_11105 [Acinetobacter baumannii]KRI74452.1 hypothetical protein APC65_15785 [Acinetobacter baumannii]OBN68286.1 hypothetical protein A9894_08640 [Acinetobacter baumannii]OIG78174.1 hypothetical protein A7M82_05470 [Acinetobacter baumannii]